MDEHILELNCQIRSVNLSHASEDEPPLNLLGFAFQRDGVAANDDRGSIDEPMVAGVSRDRLHRRLLAGLLGIGGGMVMVPILVWIFAAQGLPAEHVLHVALGTSMATIFFTSLSSMRAHHRRGAVDADRQTRRRGSQHHQALAASRRSRSTGRPALGHSPLCPAWLRLARSTSCLTSRSCRAPVGLRDLRQLDGVAICLSPCTEDSPGRCPIRARARRGTHPFRSSSSRGGP